MLNFQHRAIAQCDHEECVMTEEFKRDSESIGLKDFMQAARHHFEGRGWSFYGQTICPKQHLHDVAGFHQLAFAVGGKP